jgi:hypothetical protein
MCLSVLGQGLIPDSCNLKIKHKIKLYIYIYIYIFADKANLFQKFENIKNNLIININILFMPKLAMYYITPAPGSEYLQHTH